MSNSDSLQSCPVVECVSKLNVVTQSLFIAFIYEFDFGKKRKASRPIKVYIHSYCLNIILLPLKLRQYELILLSSKFIWQNVQNNIEVYNIYL